MSSSEEKAKQLVVDCKEQPLRDIYHLRDTIPYVRIDPFDFWPSKDIKVD